MLLREKYIKEIARTLAALVACVKIENSIHFLDINSSCEDFYSKLLNLIFDRNYENLNTHQINTPSIDLADKVSGLAMQVTSDNTSQKIKDTIESFIEHELHEKYQRLDVLILGDKKDYTTTFDTQGLFSFTNANILDYTDLIKEVNKLPIEKLEQVVDFLRREVDLPLRKAKKIESNEVETIIKLIDFLSISSAENDDRFEKEPDPEKKLYQRFSDYSDFLLERYKDAFTVFGVIMDEAKKNAGIDTLRAKKISLFLKQKSDSILNDCGGNPRKALDQITYFFEEKLQNTGDSYDSAAISFYLLDEIIKCNVFPNIKTLANG